jgi:hypothetical protein
VEKNLTIKMGNCNHRAYVARLVEWVRAGAIDPERVLTQSQPLIESPLQPRTRLGDRDRQPAGLSVCFGLTAARKRWDAHKRIQEGLPAVRAAGLGPLADASPS